MDKALLSRPYDAIVIGSGPGGATVARDLTLKGKKVLILEWGPGGKVSGTLFSYVLQQCFPFRSLLITNKFLGMVRGITTGGSSLFYYGTCFPVPFEMLKKYGIDITKEVAEARREIPIAPLKDEMMTPMAGMIFKSARELGYDWKKLDKFMYQDRWSPGTPFGYYGDPRGVKWSARMFVDEAVARGAVLVNGAKVKRVIIENGSVSGVVFTRRGRSYTVKAPVTVLAAGGIGSPVVLRKSGVDRAGYDFFFDPLLSVCGVVDRPIKRTDEIPMSAGVHMKDRGYMMTDMSLPGIIDKVFAAEVFRFTRLFESRRTLRIMIKARDGLGGRLTDSGGVRKRLADEDRDRLLDGARRAKEILERAGAKKVYRTWYLAAHPGGTVKIGELLDSDLSVKGVKGLYVCDCSVIPEPWGLPPTLTIVGLGKYLAKRLAGETARGEKLKPAAKKASSGKAAKKQRARGAGSR